MECLFPKLDRKRNGLVCFQHNKRKAHNLLKPRGAIAILVAILLLFQELKFAMVFQQITLITLTTKRTNTSQTAQLTRSDPTSVWKGTG